MKGTIAPEMGTPTPNEPALAALVLQLDRFRKKRNIGGYERAGAVSDQEAAEMLALAMRVRHDVVAWIEMEHPDLL